MQRGHSVNMFEPTVGGRHVDIRQSGWKLISKVSRLLARTEGGTDSAAWRRPQVLLWAGVDVVGLGFLIALEIAARGYGKPGPITKSLSARFSKYTRDYRGNSPNPPCQEIFPYGSWPALCIG